MTPVTSHRAWLAQTLVCALLSAAAAPALAQTQADLFNDSTVQDIHLTVSSRDWEALKAHADENTYYAADLRWRGLTVRNVGIRSRGAGIAQRRQARVAGRHEPLRRSELPRPAGPRSRQRVHRPVGAA